MLQNVAVALGKARFFSKNVAVACILEGYPSSLFTTATLLQLLLIFPLVLDGFEPPSGLREPGSGRVTTHFPAVVNNDKMTDNQQSSD